MAASSSQDLSELGPRSPVTRGRLSDIDLEFCAQDYSKYIKVDVSSEVNHFENIVEDMLVRLDEFCQTADMIRNESGMFLSDLLPRINAQSKELPAIFEKIDQLEAFIPIVRKNVDELEEKVNTAEKELGAGKVSTIKGLLNSLPIRRFRQKKEPKPPHAEWTPISLINTKQYFTKEELNIEVSHNENNTDESDNNIPS